MPDVCVCVCVFAGMNDLSDTSKMFDMPGVSDMSDLTDMLARGFLILEPLEFLENIYV